MLSPSSEVLRFETCKTLGNPVQTKSWLLYAGGRTTTLPKSLPTWTMLWSYPACNLLQTKKSEMAKSYFVKWLKGYKNKNVFSCLHRYETENFRLDFQQTELAWLQFWQWFYISEVLNTLLPSWKNVLDFVNHCSRHLSCVHVHICLPARKLFSAEVSNCQFAAEEEPQIKTMQYKLQT